MKILVSLKSVSTKDLFYQFIPFDKSKVTEKMSALTFDKKKKKKPGESVTMTNEKL